MHERYTAQVITVIEFSLTQAYPSLPRGRLRVLDESDLYFSNNNFKPCLEVL